jgi:hypothetical protein
MDDTQKRRDYSYQRVNFGCAARYARILPPLSDSRRVRVGYKLLFAVEGVHQLRPQEHRADCADKYIGKPYALFNGGYYSFVVGGFGGNGDD